jgi:hypothetical protein
MKKTLLLVLSLISMLLLVADPVDTLFESFDLVNNIPNNWNTIIDVNESGDVWVQTSQYDSYSGEHYLRMSCGSELGQDNVYLVTPELTDPSAHTLRFYAKSTYGTETDQVKVGLMTNPNDASTFTEIATVALTGSYTLNEIEFDASVEGNYIAFLNSPSVDYAVSIYIDDISWEAEDTIPNPASAISPAENEENVLINLDTNYMETSFEWTSNGGNPTSYKLFVGTDYPPTNLANGIDVGNTFSYSLTEELEYSTAYNWQIVPTNEQGDATDCPIWTFTTQGDIVIDFNYVDEYFEGFEDAEVGYLPIGMTYADNNNDDSYWSAIANSEASQNAHSGNNGVHMRFSFAGDHDDWLWTPALNMIGGNTYHISFWYTGSAMSASSEAMKVAIGSTPSAAGMTVELFDDFSIDHTTYQMVTVEFTPEEDGIQFLGFYAYTAMWDQFVLLLDDISIVEEPVANDESDVTLPSIALSNYPNPFNPETTINYSIPAGTKASIAVYNVKGQLVKSFNNLESNTHKVVWNGTNNDLEHVPSGIYFYKLTAGEFSTVKKMTLLK